MTKAPGRRQAEAEQAGEDLKRVVKVGPAGVLPAVMIILALIATLMFGITLLFRN